MPHLSAQLGAHGHRHFNMDANHIFLSKYGISQYVQLVVASTESRVPPQAPGLSPQTSYLQMTDHIHYRIRSFSIHGNVDFYFFSMQGGSSEGHSSAPLNATGVGLPFISKSPP